MISLRGSLTALVDTVVLFSQSQLAHNMIAMLFLEHLSGIAKKENSYAALSTELSHFRIINE